MSELSEHFDIAIGRGVTVKDVLEHPEKHHWKLSYKFKGSRNKYGTPNGVPYGTSSSFSKIYKSLGDDFIGDYLANDYPNSDVKAYGDELLSRINEEIGIYVNSYQTAEGEVFQFERNLSKAKTRYKNAQSKYDSAWQKLQEENENIESFAETIPLNLKGEFDRRTKEYKYYARTKADLDKALDKIDTKYESELVRYTKAVTRYETAVTQFENIRSKSFDPKGKFQEASEDFAERVHKDIIARGEDGRLPRQNMPLAEATIERRMKSRIPGAPRYWATGQLIMAVTIKCTLV